MTKPGDSQTTNWEEEYKKEHKLRQEAEGELTIVKGISVHMSPEMRDADKEINNLKNDIANLKETLKSRDYFEKDDYKYLIEQNQRLEQENLELYADNKKLAAQVEDQVERARKAGM